MSTQSTNASSSVSTESKGYGYSPVGLGNIGNTCFMNSILQCIFATAPLTQYFLKQYPSEKAQRSTNISDSYLELLKESRNVRSGGAVRPSDLKNALSRVSR